MKLLEPEFRGNLLAGREFDLVRAVRRQLAALHGSAVADFRPGQDYPYQPWPATPGVGFPEEQRVLNLFEDLDWAVIRQGSDGGVEFALEPQGWAAIQSFAQGTWPEFQRQVEVALRAPPGPLARNPITGNGQVFIIHGEEVRYDNAAQEYRPVPDTTLAEVYAAVAAHGRPFGIAPAILQLESGQWIYEEVERQLARCAAAIVILNADREAPETRRVRFNPILEMGMALRSFGREWVPVILCDDNLIGMSDIAGMFLWTPEEWPGRLSAFLADRLRPRLAAP